MDRFVYDRVYLIGIDGAGNFFTKTPTPRIDEIFARGAYNHRTLTAIPTISAQCWGSMLHGCTPSAHRLTNGTSDIIRLDGDFKYPSFFNAARHAFPDAEIASVSNWNSINIGIIEQGLNIRMATGDDDAVCDTVCEYIDKYDPKLLFVQFDSVDGAGHGYGYGFPGHLEQITYVDGLVGRIYDAAKKKHGMENTLFLVTADHGGTPDRNHGGDTDAEKYVSFFAAGSSVNPGEFGYMEIRDTASIIAFALGIPQPETWSSRIPDGLFRDGVSFERKSEANTDGTKRYSGRPSAPTPDTAGKDLASFADTGRMLCRYEFDGNAVDAVSGKEAVIDGKIYYTEGFYSQCATLDDCTVKPGAIHFGTDDFTVCLWIKTDKTAKSEKRVVFSTKNDDDPYSEGIELYISDGKMNIILGTGEKTAMRYQTPLPPNYENNWFHFITSLDRSENELCSYYDFCLDYDWYLECHMPEENTLDGDTAHAGNKTSVSIDDLIVFPYKLSDPEIDGLQRYYEQ